MANDKQEGHPLADVEQVVALLERLESAARKGREIEFWVPDRVAIGDELMDKPTVTTILFAKALELFLEPIAVEDGDGGTMYRYRRVTP